MAISFSRDLKNNILNKAFITSLAGSCGTAGTASLKIYSGTQPANADAATSGVLLVTISNIGWGTSFGATNGTAALAIAAGYTGTAATSGTATWGRMECVTTGYTGSAATCRLDGEVSTVTGSTFVINNATIETGAVITLQSATIYLA
jgi:hypothetical protein